MGLLIMKGLHLDKTTRKKIRGSGKDRRTLTLIPYYPTPKEIYKELVASNGWPYKSDMEFYRVRDHALISILYLGALRVSEALPLSKDQFVFLGIHIELRSIKLSKAKVKGKPRRVAFRNARFPLRGERKEFTKLVMLYLEELHKKEKLFKFKTCARAWQIVTSYLPYTCHWLRAFCENYLYDNWNKDLLAVADFVKVDPKTLSFYIRKKHENYPVI